MNTHVRRKRRSSRFTPKGMGNAPNTLKKSKMFFFWAPYCTWPLPLIWDYPSGEPSRPTVHLMLSKDFLKIISDSQWHTQTEASLQPGRKAILGERQMVLSDHWGPSQADGESKISRWRIEIDWKGIAKVLLFQCHLECQVSLLVRFNNCQLTYS